MRKLKYIVPNAITAMSLLLGVVAIIIAVEGFLNNRIISFFNMEGPHAILAAWITVWCVLLDKLDGFFAKAFNATTDFGAQFDSMADLVSFGITPGLISYGAVYAIVGDAFFENRLLLIACIGAYILAAAVRLARFNAVDIDEFPDYFRGLPSTIAGGIMAMVIILLYKYKEMIGVKSFIIIIESALIICAVLMVSPLLLSKLKPRKSKLINFFQIVNIAIGYACGIGMLFPEYLFSLIVLYLSVGFTYGIIKKDEIVKQTRSTQRVQ
ncbi:MAG: CDP-alcohol phosphatidyltransferase family protein [Spirochaetes bacterium]|nr:CDP-alcohol phosphatidyltransferase family protein [Spirochaetota bacterium]